MLSIDEIEQKLSRMMYNWMMLGCKPTSYKMALHYIPDIHEIHRYALQLEGYVKIHGPNMLMKQLQICFLIMCEDVLRYVRDRELTDIYVRFLVFTENGVTAKGSLSHQ